MIYAQILGGRVLNTIVLTDTTLEPVFLDGFDFLIRIDELNPIPQIDWTYDGENFSPPPPPPEPDPVEEGE